MSLGTIPFEESTLDAMYEVEVPSSESAGFYLYTVGAMQNTGDVKLKTFWYREISLRVLNLWRCMIIDELPRLLPLSLP